jgi:hypothetical protein
MRKRLAVVLFVLFYAFLTSAADEILRMNGDVRYKFSKNVLSVTFFCENTMPLFAHKSRQNIPNTKNDKSDRIYPS